MIPNPIHKVLSTLSTHEVRYLLMGGQACVFYGAAEFSRDCDIAIVCEPQNLERLRAALNELSAEPIAVPPFTAEHLERGHAVHFRCQAEQAAGIRVDVMAKMRGVAPFEELWSRRATLVDDAGARIELMALFDLVAAKKTQRDKDWPMIRRLVEAHYSQYSDSPTEEFVRFWLRESRTPKILIDLATHYQKLSAEIARQRPLVLNAVSAGLSPLEQALDQEEHAEREADRRHWEPLKRELEQLRRAQRLGE